MYSEIQMELDSDGQRDPVRVIVSYLSMGLVPLALIIWVYAITHGEQAIPFVPCNSSPFFRIFHRISPAIVTWGPLACVLSIYASAFALGRDRDQWFRRACFFAFVVVATFGFWATLSRLYY